MVVLGTCPFGVNTSEDIKMRARKNVFSRFSRGAVLATVVAAVALAAVEPSVAMAGTARSPVPGISANHGVSGSTDISAARRRHYGRGGGGAAAMAAFAGIVGTIGAVAAAQQRRDYDYDGGPAYYGGGPAYYGSPGYGYYGGGYGAPNPLGYGYNDRGGF
jgi:hypothetical protein